MADDFTHWLFVGFIGVLVVAFVALAILQKIERRRQRRRYGTIKITSPLWRPLPPLWRPIARWRQRREPFYITIDAGTPNQEILQVTGWNKTELTVRGRGLGADK